jgi:hypothetical protein
MQQQEDDAILTQLSSAWVALAMGGDRVSEAMSTLQELVERHEASPILLNSLAICNLHQKKYDEAERYDLFLDYQCVCLRISVSMRVHVPVPLDLYLEEYIYICLW